MMMSAPTKGNAIFINFLSASPSHITKTRMLRCSYTTVILIQ